MAYMPLPKCLAKTGKTLSVDSFHGKVEERDHDTEDVFYKSAEWTPDGTSVVTNSTDNHIRTFIVPPDLLDEREDPQTLQSYSIIPSHEPINTIAQFPLWQLQDPSSALVLSSPREHPIRLNSSLTSELLASYPYFNPLTEAIITPTSLGFTSDGSKFLAGADSSISTFDVSRPGQQPISSFQTGSKSRNRLRHNPNTSMNGLVSALAIDASSGLLAAGTYTRNIGLYDSVGRGECVGVFTVAQTKADKAIGGRGVHQLQWSPCGRYLYIIERKSDGIILYDIRKTGQLLSWLEGRRAMTNQRLSVDIFPGSTENAQEIWAGGVDGKVRMWPNPHFQEGPIAPEFEWAAHEDAVNSTSMHRTGGVLATASGQRRFDTYANGYKGKHVPPRDLSMKIWSLI